MNENNIFYVYEWYNVQTGEVFYVGKGCKKRAYELSKRNKLFQEYRQNNEIAVRIFKDHMSEEEAFQLEAERIKFYKNQGQCSANVSIGGSGGHNFVWTQEMREYKSKYNPMKDEKQRYRMKDSNPMHNEEVAKKVGQKHRKAVMVKGKIYSYAKEAAESLGIHEDTVRNWAKRGFDSQNEPCYYIDEGPKDYTPIKKGKAVIIDGILYNTVKEGAQAIGVTISGLGHALKEQRDCRGHKCEYANQQPNQ